MDIEAKALALVNAEQAKSGCLPIGDYHGPCMKALCRAIERHEAFRREVSEAVEKHKAGMYLQDTALDRFIIPQVDPLHECLEEALARTGEDLTEHTERLRAALAARGLQIVKKEPSQ